MNQGRVILGLAAVLVGICCLLSVVAGSAYYFLRPGPQCTEVLDQDTMDRLVLSMEQNLEIQPSEARALSLGVVECCYCFVPVKACATWSVSPSEGVRIDPDTGVLTVNPETPSGSVFTVEADVENGRRVVSTEVHVFTPQGSPLVGTWKEEAQFACAAAETVAPREPIRELRFRADGGFSVTWTPFEVYKDYWGTYTYDAVQGTLDLVVTRGNYVPDDVDGSGRFSVDAHGHLVLDDMWLGCPRDDTGVANCGHRFTRLR
jgi:hypothetical protein